MPKQSRLSVLDPNILRLGAVFDTAPTPRWGGEHRRPMRRAPLARIGAPLGALSASAASPMGAGPARARRRLGNTDESPLRSIVSRPSLWAAYVPLPIFRPIGRHRLPIEPVGSKGKKGSI